MLALPSRPVREGGAVAGFVGGQPETVPKARLSFPLVGSPAAHSRLSCGHCLSRSCAHRSPYIPDAGDDPHRRRGGSGLPHHGGHW